VAPRRDPVAAAPAPPASDVDGLYALPRAEFVGARNALARRLRAAGETEAAARVARLRKPSAPVWAIDRLARSDPAGIDRLLDATDRLRATQLGRAGTEDVGAVSAAQRAALEALVERAVALLRGGEGAGSPDTRARIAATLLGAAADPRRRADLRRGRLDRELAAPGFEVFAGSRPAAVPGPAPPVAGRAAERRRAAAARRRAAREAVRAQAAVRAARAEARRLARRAATLAAGAEHARRAADQAAAAAAAARQEADHAAAALAAAEQAAAAGR